MKKFLQFIALGLCLIMCCSACNCNNNEQSDNTFEGEHDHTAVETQTDFIVDGATNYMILLPENAGDLLSTARTELAYFFQMATDIVLQSTMEDKINDFAGRKFISIGETELLKNSDLEIDRAKLGNDGFNIFTGEDENIYLIGGSDYGSLYAVYGFLSIMFNYECYYADCYEIDTGVRNLKLRDFQVTDIPDISTRAYGYGIYTNNSNYDLTNFRYRMHSPNARGANLMPIFDRYNDPSASSARSTNADWYFPQDIYNNPDVPETYHPKWYSTRSTSTAGHFCFTARGDEAEYQAMVEECAKKIENSLVIFPRATYGQYTAVSMTTQDNRNLCTCETCMRDVEIYGYGGIVARFINDVGVLVEEWMEKPENEPYKRDNFRIIFFAYQSYEQPPVVRDESTGGWKAVDDTVVLRDNVGVYLAPIQSFAYERSIYDSENDYGRDVLEGWAALTDCIYLWTYSTNFTAYMFISDTYSMFNEEGYQYFASFNVDMIVNQGQWDTPYSTAWHNLKMYLDAKLQWDCSLSTQTLTDNFFNAMYGPAAQAMQDLFAEQIAYTRKTFEDAGFYNAGSTTLDSGVKQSQYWPLALLESWIEKFDAAKALLDSNDPKYEMYASHIEFETVSPLYLILYFYGNESSALATASRTEYRNRLAEDIREMGLSGMRLQEATGSISDILE